MKSFPFLIVIALTVNACQSAPTPQNAVSQFLSALKEGDGQRQSEVSCRLKKSAVFLDSLGQVTSQNTTLQGIEKWEFVDTSQVSSESNPDNQYFSVLAKITSAGKGGFQVARTWEFTVWNSDALFEADKRSADEGNRLIAESEETTRMMEEMMGKTSTPKTKSEMLNPLRSAISSQPYCILRVQLPGRE